MGTEGQMLLYREGTVTRPHWLSSGTGSHMEFANLVLTCEQVRHWGTFELQTLTSVPLVPFGAFNKDQQRFPEIRECFVTITLPSANMSLSEITLILANKNRTVTAVLEVLHFLPSDY